MLKGITNWAKNMYGKFKLGCYGFNYRENAFLSSCIRRLLDEEWIYVRIDNGYWLYIITKNGTEAQLWNENKYYAWMRSGEISFYTSVGDFRKRHVYSWENKLPSIYLMYLFQKKLSQYLYIKLTCTALS